MKLLAIETSTEACSAALWLDGEIYERYQYAPREHSQLILPMMDALLADAGLAVTDLSAIAFGRGPGSFTGVRIATGVAQGAAFGAELPVLPISTLAALADDCFHETGHKRMLAAIDARMQQVYAGSYAVGDGGVRLLGIEQVVAPAAIELPDSAEVFGVGSGWLSYTDGLSKQLGQSLVGWMGDRYPRARAIARLAAIDFAAGLAVPAEEALPVYLRDDVAKAKATPA